MRFVGLVYETRFLFFTFGMQINTCKYSTLWDDFSYAVSCRVKLRCSVSQDSAMILRLF